VPGVIAGNESEVTGSRMKPDLSSIRLPHEVCIAIRCQHEEVVDLLACVAGKNMWRLDDEPVREP